MTCIRSISRRSTLLDAYEFLEKAGTALVARPVFYEESLSGIVANRLVRKRSVAREQLFEHLRFENLVSKPKFLRAPDDDREYIKTIFASVDKADLPSESLAYCGYDIVLLMGEELRGLRKPQLEALLAWVRAGGSLYVEPNGILESYHLDFLKNLVADDPQGLEFQLDIAGRLPPETIDPNRIAAVVDCGVGVAVIRTGDPDQELSASDDEWRAVVGPLWKMRMKPVEAPPSSLANVGPDGRPTFTNVPSADPYGLHLVNLNRIRLGAG